MIVPEDTHFEREVFRQGSPVAVPAELTVGADGGLKILAFSFAVPACEAFEREYGDDPLSEDALKSLTDALSPLMLARGYDECDTADYPLLDYRPGAVSSGIDTGGVTLIDTLDGEEWDEGLPLEEFALDPAMPADRMAVVRDGEGRIVCFAGLNDISEDEGFCELNVECAERYRGRGFGPACTALLTAYLTGLGERVQYVTSCRNAPSVRCAEKAGLVLANRVFPVVFRRSGEDDADFFDFT